MKISANFIHVYPLKKPYYSPVWRAPFPGGLLLSTLAPKWAALTLTLCAQHCVPVSHLHVPHQHSASTFSTSLSTVYEAPSCLTQLLTARTVLVSSSSFLIFGTCVRVHLKMVFKITTFVMRNVSCTSLVLLEITYNRSILCKLTTELERKFSRLILENDSRFVLP